MGPEELWLCGQFWRSPHWTEQRGKLQGKLNYVEVDAGEPALNRKRCLAILHFYFESLQEKGACSVVGLFTIYWCQCHSSKKIGGFSCCPLQAY